jgi:Outer membrane protein beta-barrel family
MRSALLFIVCLAISYLSYSQSKSSSLKGIITDSLSGQPLLQASVTLINCSDSVVSKQSLSGKKGFELEDIDSGDYLLRVSYIDYEPAIIPITVGNVSKIYDAGKIPLVKSGHTLMEVVVKSVIPPVIVRNDTLVYNTDAVKTQPNATIEELLKKLPGIDIDKDGNIFLHGQKVEKIYIDGKEFFLNDPRMATQNLTADMVEAVEAFDNRSEKSRFSGINEISNSKAINIRLKKDKKKGLLGNVIMGVGNQHTYSGNGNVTYLNRDRWVWGGVNGNYANSDANNADGMKAVAVPIGVQQSAINGGVNYRDNIGKKIQLVANYRSNGSRNQSGQLYRRETFLEDSLLLQNANSVSDNRTVNHNFNANLTYTIDSFNSVVYTPYISWQQNEAMNSDSSFILSEKNGASYLSNEGKTRNYASSNSSNYSNTVAWRRSFRKQRRSVYAVLTQGHQQESGQGNLYSWLKFYDNTGLRIQNRTVRQQYQQESNGNNYGLNVYYTEPINAKQVIDVGAGITSSHNLSGKQAFNYDSSTRKYDQADTLTTNQFNNSNLQGNFSIGYNYIGKKAQYQLGVNVLYSSMKNESDKQKYTTIEQKLFNWSPRASAFYRLAQQKNLQVQYNGRNTAPTTEMLQPIPDLSNPFLIRIGNPNLKQQFQHSLDVVYNSSNSKTFRNLSLRLGSNFTSNKLVQSSVISSTGIQELMYVNANGVYSLGGSLVYGFALNKTKNGGGSIVSSVQYDRDVNFVNEEENIRRSIILVQRFQLNYHVSERLYAGVQASVMYNHSHYSIGGNLNTELISQNYSSDITYLLCSTMRVSTDFIVRVNGAQGNLPGRTIPTWNAAIYRNILKNKAEIRLTGYDLLNQNKGFYQVTGDNYIETRESGVLKRYFLLSFRYNFRKKVI